MYNNGVIFIGFLTSSFLREGLISKISQNGQQRLIRLDPPESRLGAKGRNVGFDTVHPIFLLHVLNLNIIYCFDILLYKQKGRATSSSNISYGHSRYMCSYFGVFSFCKYSTVGNLFLKFNYRLQLEQCC